MKKRRHRYYQMAGPVKYQTKGATQDNTATNMVLPYEVERANYLNSIDEFGRAYPTQQNRGTISAPVSLDPNMGFVRHAGESPAMSRYKGDVFKREIQGGFAGAGLNAAFHYGGKGLRTLRGASKMKPAVFKPARLYQETNLGPAPYKYNPPNLMQEINPPHTAPPVFRPPNIVQELNPPHTAPPVFRPPNIVQELNPPHTAPPVFRPPNIVQELNPPHTAPPVFRPPNIVQEFDVPRVPRTKPGPANVMQEADRAFTPKGRPGPAKVKPEFDVPRASRAKPGPAQVKPEDDTFKMAAEISNAGPGSPGYSSLSRGQMTASEFEKALSDAIAREEAKKFLEEALKKKFRYGGAARRYMRY